MIDFYKEWVKAEKENKTYYVDSFLRNDFISKYPFYNYSYEELTKVIKNILKLDRNEIIKGISDQNITILPFMINQFSNFDDGVFEIPRILSFENNLSFKQIGKKLIKNGKPGACLKYGENHSKLAETFLLVHIDNGEVSLSSFGNIFVPLNKETQKKLLEIIVLSDRLTQKIIACAKTGICFYDNLTKNIVSKTTALRRKSNVKRLLYLALQNTDYEYLLENVKW